MMIPVTDRLFSNRANGYLMDSKRAADFAKQQTICDCNRQLPSRRELWVEAVRKWRRLVAADEITPRSQATRATPGSSEKLK